MLIRRANESHDHLNFRLFALRTLRWENGPFRVELGLATGTNIAIRIGIEGRVSIALLAAQSTQHG